MITFVVAIGIVPLHQFEVVFQSVLVYPVHVPATHEYVETLMSPVPDVKYVGLMKLAEDPVPPHEPADSPLPPRIIEFAACVNPVPKLAVTPLFIVKIPLVVIATAKVFVLLPAKVKLLKVVVEVPAIV